MAIEQRKNELTQQLDREPTMVGLAVDIDKSELEIAQIQKLGQRAKQKMVTANLRLVVSINQARLGIFSVVQSSQFL